MARNTYEAFIPTEFSPKVIQAALRTSAVERIGRPEPMNAAVKDVPRHGNVTVGVVAKGGTYAESTGTQDTVEMVAKKIGAIVRIAEEDMTDTVTGEQTLNHSRIEATRAIAKFYDNACLGVTAASNGTTIPYTSVYRAVSQYSSGVNLIQTAGAPTYADFSNLFGKLEESDWWDDGNMFLIGSPAWRKLLRDVVDDEGRPMWRAGLSESDPNTIYGMPVAETVAAKTSSVATANPSSGNPLLILGNRELLIRGIAKLTAAQADANPGFKVQRADVGSGFDTDELKMKAVMRRGFVLGDVSAFAVLEYTAS